MPVCQGADGTLCPDSYEPARGPAAMGEVSSFHCAEGRMAHLTHVSKTARSSMMRCEFKFNCCFTAGDLRTVAMKMMKHNRLGIFDCLDSGQAKWDVNIVSACRESQSSRSSLARSRASSTGQVAASLPVGSQTSGPKFDLALLTLKSDKANGSFAVSKGCRAHSVAHCCTERNSRQTWPSQASICRL